MMINAVCRALGKPDQLPRNHQMMLFWAGLRGAVAFALASGISGESAPAMRTTILAVVVLTVLLFGGTTSRMLQVLDVRTGVIEPDESGSENEDNEPETMGGNRKTRYTKVSQYEDNGLNDDDDDDDLLASGSHRRNQHYNDQSIGGLLSGPLGEPIPEDRPPHWFVSFDEKWLKPFLTKKHIQQRNLTLAEYWKEKRRKMERANRSMLDGIRIMNGDEDDNSDALTLNSVKGATTTSRNTNANTSFPRPNLNGGGSSSSSNRNISSTSSSKLVVGSGRVFGRSPSLDSDAEEYNDRFH